MADGNYQGARESLDRALAIARREINIDLEMRSFNSLSQVELWHLHLEDSLKSSLMAIDLAVAASDIRTEVASRYWAGLASSALGDSEESSRQALAILEPAQRLQDRYWLASAHQILAGLHTRHGEWQTAREAIQRGLDLLPLDPRLLSLRITLEANVGDKEQVDFYLERLEGVVRQSDRRPNTTHSSLAMISPMIRSILDPVKHPIAGEDSIKVVLSSPFATPYFSAWARIGAALTAVIEADPIAAGEQYPPLKESAGTYIFVASVDRMLGLLADTMGNPEDAGAHFEDALNFCRRSDYRPELAWTYFDYANALLRRKRESDSTKTLTLLNDCLSISTELGMKPLMERCQQRLEQLKADW